MELLLLLLFAHSSVPANAKEPIASCYYFGCGVYDAVNACQCNKECTADLNNDCCADYAELCKHGYFEECPLAPSTTEDRRSDQDKLTLMSYNLEWLFVNYSHSMGGNYCPGSGCTWTSTPSAYDHLQAIATNLDSFNADIIVVQEVCDCWTLMKLVQRMPENGEHYRPYLIRGTDSATGQNVALITKIDPVESLTRSDEYVQYPVAGSTCGSTASGTQGCSKHLHAKFKLAIAGEPRILSLFNLHFLARPDDQSRCPRREGQAQVIANQVKQAYENGHLIVVAGDFNDFSSSVSDINSHKPITAVESILINAGNLVNAAHLIQQQEERYSDWYHCSSSCQVTDTCLSMLDHVLVSETGLFDRIKKVWIDHHAQNGCVTNYSDHWPIVVQFDLKDVLPVG